MSCELCNWLKRNNCIVFKDKYIFAEIHLQTKNKQLCILIRDVEDLDDPYNITERVPDTHGWSLKIRFYISKLEDVDKAVALIKQSYESQVVK